mmetsp:Transcript_4806/g.15219  ORF Transcript_4806/g.15219 Transcript_4806/m.15219 type:complete len:200 (+) Transcript_4806:394-993(+)
MPSATPAAMLDAWPMHPTVRKSRSCDCPRFTRHSKTSRDGMPVVETMKSFSATQSSSASIASSRDISSAAFFLCCSLMLASLCLSKVSRLMSSAYGVPCSAKCAAALASAASVTLATSSPASSTLYGTSHAASASGIRRPCATCCGSSFFPCGSPRQPTSMSIGILHTSACVSESSGLTVLPIPLFCRYTTGTLPVDMW